MIDNAKVDMEKFHSLVDPIMEPIVGKRPFIITLDVQEKDIQDEKYSMIWRRW